MGSLFQRYCRNICFSDLNVCFYFTHLHPIGKMACTKSLALCLLMVAGIYAESDADAESDAFYGYSGGAHVLRSYPAYRRSYYSPHAYRRPYGAYHAPARRYSYRLLGPAPAPAPAPVPVRQSVAKPAYAP